MKHVRPWTDEPGTCAVELRRCSHMHELSLEVNRLATPVLDLRALSGLRSLQLYGNPLEFIPELSPCTVRAGCPGRGCARDALAPTHRHSSVRVHQNLHTVFAGWSWSAGQASAQADGRLLASSGAPRL